MYFTFLYTYWNCSRNTSITRNYIILLSLIACDFLSDAYPLTYEKKHNSQPSRKNITGFISVSLPLLNSTQILKILGNRLHFFLYIRCSRKDFPEISCVESFRMSYRACRFGCDRSIIRGTLLGKQSTSSAYLGFRRKHFLATSHLALSTHAQQKK
jgi:hypothetical protein